MSNSECSVWSWAFVNEINQSEFEISYMMYKKHFPKHLHSTVWRKSEWNPDQEQVLVVAASPDVGLDVIYRMCKFHLWNWFNGINQALRDLTWWPWSRMMYIECIHAHYVKQQQELVPDQDVSQIRYSCAAIIWKNFRPIHLERHPPIWFIN